MRATADPPAVILLDALGTLVALEPPAPRLGVELADRFGLDVSEDQAASAIAAEIRYYRGHLDDGRDPEALQALRRRCAATLRSALPAAALELELEPLVEALLASLHFTAFADVRPALDAARPGGSGWSSSATGTSRCTASCARSGSSRCSMGSSPRREAGARKPAPAIFAQALALVGASPDEAIHVGDSLDEDIAGARAAGIEPVLIRRDGGAEVAGVRTISTLAGLVDSGPARPS